MAVLLFVLSTEVRAQFSSTATTARKADSTKTSGGVKQRRPGFDLPDSLYVVHDSIRSDIDTIIQYTAKDSIVFDVNRKTMTLVDQATMDFQSRELRAYTIVLDFQKNTLTAFSDEYDSVISSSLARRRRIIRDTNRVKTRGAPILSDNGTPYEGEIIIYNFKTKRGTVQLGTTTMEGGFYYGEKIKQVDSKTLFVQNGRFTTCDAPIPHYYFESPKMKVIMQDQVFAEPVYLYIADVPIFALPFGVFPNHGGGRHSGIIAPNYQTTGDRGYGLTHLGYYQVFSDYFDAYAQGDIYTKGGYNAESKLSFMKRYLFSGPVTLLGSYGNVRYSSDQPFTKTWRLAFAMPNLILGPNTNLSANLDFDNRNYLNATNLNQALQQTTSSRASFQTAWEDLGLSMGIDYNRQQTYLAGDPNDPLSRVTTYNETSPSMNLSLATFFPFASTAQSGSTEDRSVLQSLGISWSARAERSLSKTFISSGIDSGYHYSERYGITHSPTISISPKLGYFTLTPSVSYSGAVFVKRIAKRTPYIRTDSSVAFDDSIANGFNYVNSYSGNLALSTTLFGIANIGALGVKAIRHTIQPSISLSYHPDLSYQEAATYIDPISHKEVRYSIYSPNDNAPFAMEQKSATLGFSLNNDFEAKVEHQVTKDSTSEEKVKLLNVGLNSGYDLIQKIYRPIAMSASSRVGSALNISANASFDVRRFDSVANRYTYLKPTGATVSLSGGVSSSTTTDGENMDSLRNLIQIQTPEDEREALLGGFFPGSFSRVIFRPTWNVSYNLSYTESYGALGTTRNFSADLQLSFSPTKNWTIGGGSGYDLTQKKIVIPDLRIHRDLHCWEMNFDYRPSGFYRGFNFEIRVKAEQLRDIKLTRTESSIGNF